MSKGTPPSGKFVRDDALSLATNGTPRWRYKKCARKGGRQTRRAHRDPNGRTSRPVERIPVTAGHYRFFATADDERRRHTLDRSRPRTVDRDPRGKPRRGRPAPSSELNFVPSSSQSLQLTVVVVVVEMIAGRHCGRWGTVTRTVLPQGWMRAAKFIVHNSSRILYDNIMFMQILLFYWRNNNYNIIYDMTATNGRPQQWI